MGGTGAGVDDSELAARLLATFVGELEDQVRLLNADLLALESDPGDAGHLKSLFRVAHTVKGAARAVGVTSVEQVCHEMESLMVQVRDGKRALGAAEFALFFSVADALTDAGLRLKARRDLAGSGLSGIRDALRRLVQSRPPEAAPAAPAPVPPTAPPTAPSPAAPAADAPPAPTSNAPRGDDHVRVAAQALDAVLASTGQLLVAGNRVTTRQADLAALHDAAASSAAEWQRTGRRVRRTLERAGAPPAVAKALRAVEEEWRRIVQETGRLTANASADARALAQVTDEMAESVRHLRLRPFADACEALPRAIRDVAAAAGKEARLDLLGGDVQADRAVLDGLRDAILHLVRNAVDHGIESPAVRERAGKPRAGTVTVAAAIRGPRIVVTVADDGQGLDVPAIRAELERAGAAVPADERDLAQALFAPGLSTRAETTAISGRGVGLDLVRTAVARIRGTVDVAWVPGAGTTFRIECPPTLATIRALLVSVGPQIVAIPTADVARLVRVAPDQIRHAEGRHLITTADGPVPLVSLARLLPPLVEHPAEGALSVVILAAGDRRLAVSVDVLLTEQEVVLREMGLNRHPPAGLSGAALLGTGRVALVLDAAAIVATGLGPGAAAGVAIAAPRAAGPAKRRILVVDDSITTRTLERSMLEAAGYQVTTAVDGTAAWKLLQEAGADLVVSDVEMPGMDGFALCETIRASARFRTLPVILVTALETPEHRARGLEVGADAYIGKAGFDQRALLDTVHQLLG